MTELTKEYFDKQLGNLATKEEIKTLATKTELTEQFEKMAVMINNAFQDQKDHFDKRFDAVESDLQTVQTKLDRALYTETIHLEARIRRLEEKVGIKPAKAAT